jgi:putative endonuclease
MSSLRKKGTHNHRLAGGVDSQRFNPEAAAYGSLLSQGRRGLLYLAHVPRLHSREPTLRDPVYRGDQLSAEAARATSKRRRFVVCQSLPRSPPVYVESYDRPGEAIAREKQLKRWKRDWKIELIERENREWRDLSDLLV